MFVFLQCVLVLLSAMKLPSRALHCCMLVRRANQRLVLYGYWCYCNVPLLNNSTMGHYNSWLALLTNIQQWRALEGSFIALNSTGTHCHSLQKYEHTILLWTHSCSPYDVSIRRASLHVLSTWFCACPTYINGEKAISSHSLVHSFR